jgi:hypothetical protein
VPGSVEASFRFLAYKVTDAHLSVKQPVDYVRAIGPDDVWQMTIKIQTPQYFSKRKLYVAGEYLRLALFSAQAAAARQSETENLDDAILVVEVTASGVFSVEEGRFAKDLEDRLVKLQGPAILLPYVRATILSLLATSGFGSAMIPLINMNEVAKTALKETEIEIVDE